MIPPIINRRLRQLRMRERMLQLFWGLVRWMCLVALVLGLGCLVDWIWDRYQDVPQNVHYVLLGVTCVATLAGFIGFILVPLLTGIHDDTLALWIEEKVPEFRDRLISAVQLNRKGAKTQGMSPHLIAVVTQEAKTRAEAQSFTRVANHDRLGWAMKLLLPIVFLAILPLVAAPVTTHVLLARHFLNEVEIPRNVHIELVDRTMVRPAGEKVTVEFRVHAKDFDPAMTGDVWVTPKGMPRDRYSLEFLAMDGDTPIFTTEVAAGTIDFDYTARIGDGRLKSPGHVSLVPRPSIEELLAWTILPSYVGNGERAEIDQPRGDIIGIPGSSARVKITTPRPIAKGHLEFLAPKPAPVKKDEPGDVKDPDNVEGAAAEGGRPAVVRAAGRGEDARRAARDRGGRQDRDGPVRSRSEGDRLSRGAGGRARLREHPAAAAQRAGGGRGGADGEPPQGLLHARHGRLEGAARGLQHRRHPGAGRRDDPRPLCGRGPIRPRPGVVPLSRDPSGGERQRSRRKRSRSSGCRSRR